jgi:hypothetical protein
MKLVVGWFCIGLFACISFSCSDDAVTVKQQISVSNAVYSLKGAKLYWTKGGTLIGTNGKWNYRQYVITDGIHQGNNESLALSAYGGATFVIAFRLAIPQNEKFRSAEFTFETNWQDMPAGAWLSYFRMTVPDAIFETTESGFFGENGHLKWIMVNKTDGTLKFLVDTQVRQPETSLDVPMKLVFKGTVFDVRG